MATEKSNAVVTEKATVTTTVKETWKVIGKATATTIAANANHTYFKLY